MDDDEAVAAVGDVAAAVANVVDDSVGGWVYTDDDDLLWH